MFQRYRAWFCGIIAFLMIAASVSTGASAQSPQRIVAVGDLHGDHDAWLAIARGAGLVDGKGRWAGGRTVLVQMGDIVDRGPDSLKIIRHLMRLQREAPRRGGRVIVVVGNHEAMMMTGDLRYVHPGEYAAFADRSSAARRDRAYALNKVRIEAAYRARLPSVSPKAIRDEWLKATPLGMLEHQAAWRPDGEFGRWTLANPAVVRLGDTLFVHGGISAAYASASIEDINRRVAEALRAQDPASTAIINDPAGPLWYRGLVMRGGRDEATLAPPPVAGAAPLSIQQEVDLVVQRFAVKRIVVGHTPSRDGIIANAGGRLWRADSAISRAYGGKLSWLEIVGDRVTPREVGRTTRLDWATRR